VTGTPVPPAQYCPFAHQKDFPTGHRYCINVYTGCQDGCVYCHATYEPEHPGCKRDFEEMIRKDMEDLERFDVPPAPVHLSNSTDPFQPLEEKHGHTKIAMEQILAHRNRFTTVTILTKNPLLTVQLGYGDLLRRLPQRVAAARMTGPFLDLCRKHGVPAKFCMSNLVETP
jgi:DNA repair photolyase